LKNRYIINLSIFIILCLLPCVSSESQIRVYDKPDSLIVANSNMSVEFSKHSIYKDFYTTADSGNISKFSIGFFKIEYTTLDGKKFKAILPQENKYLYTSHIQQKEVSVSTKDKIQLETAAHADNEETVEISMDYTIFENDTSTELGFTEYQVYGKIETLSVTQLEFEDETEGSIELNFKLEEDKGCEHFIRTSEENMRIFDSEISTNKTQINIESDTFSLLFSKQENQEIDDGFVKWLTFAKLENETGAHIIPLNFSVGSDGDKVNVYVSCVIPEKTKNITFIHSFGLFENALPTNKPPLARYTPNLEIYQGDKKEIDLYDIFYDPEGGELSFCATSEHAQITISDSILSIDSVDCSSLENVTIIATDSAFESTSIIMQVHILDPSPKVKKQIEEIVVRNREGKMLNLSDYFSGKELRYSAETSTNISIEFINNSAFIQPVANWKGKEKIIITASNSLGLAKLEFQIVAEFPNHPPVSKDIPDMKTYQEMITINLSEYFQDEDGDFLTYSANSDEVSKVKIEKDKLTIYLGEYLGRSKSAKVKVAANDGMYERCESFLITYENLKFYYEVVGMVSIFIVSVSWLVIEYRKYRKEGKLPVRLEDYRRYKRKGL